MFIQIAKNGFVYITSNPGRTVLYTGATGELPERMFKHTIGRYDGFTKKYHCVDLLWFERFNTISEALKREKQMKEWKRQWKVDLINKINPGLIDLSQNWFLKKGEQGSDFRWEGSTLV